MADYTIKGRFEITVSPANVKRWLDDTEGIAGWWSDRVEGAAGTTGDSFHVTFPSSPIVFDLDVASVSDDLIEWHIPENSPWWKGTTIRFELSESEYGGTSLLFTHGGFESDEAITPAWIRFLDNLVSVAESGAPNPAVTN
jgi:hypothetical protein